ncbi:hypothetical protein QOT17_003234 [Balamuthia mandrillaris]
MFSLKELHHLKATSDGATERVSSDETGQLEATATTGICRAVLELDSSGGLPAKAHFVFHKENAPWRALEGLSIDSKAIDRTNEVKVEIKEGVLHLTFTQAGIQQHFKNGATLQLIEHYL